MIDWAVNAITDGIHQAVVILVSNWLLTIFGGVVPAAGIASWFTAGRQRKRKPSSRVTQRRQKRAAAAAIRAPRLTLIEGPFHFYGTNAVKPPKRLYAESSPRARRADAAAA